MTITAKTQLLDRVPPNKAAVSLMARLGFAARGAVYFLVGASAAIATVRPEHRAGGMTDTLAHLQRNALGPLVLLGLAIGLVCLAGWFAVVALFRDDCRGWKRVVLALGMLGDAAVYVGFTVMLLGLLLGWWRASGDHAFQAWTGWLLAQAYGRWLVGGLGIGIAAGGVGLTAWGILGKVGGRLEMRADEQQVVRPLGRASTAGRGVAIILVGVYLIGAAIHANPHEAHELGGVLSTLRATAYGQAAMAFFALAFIGSGMFDFVAALYRRFDPSHPKD